MTEVEKREAQRAFALYGVSKPWMLYQFDFIPLSTLREGREALRVFLFGDNEDEVEEVEDEVEEVEDTTTATSESTVERWQRVSEAIRQQASTYFNTFDATRTDAECLNEIRRKFAAFKRRFKAVCPDDEECRSQCETFCRQCYEAYNTLKQQWMRRQPSALFGVEIECFCNREDFISAANIASETIRSESYNHETKTYFKIVHDGSLHASHSYVDGRQIEESEIVSPVLNANGDGFERLENVCYALQEGHAITNKTCGLHVHVDAENLTPLEYFNVFNNYAHLEPLIDSWMPTRRRGNNAYYARSNRRILSDDINHLTYQYKHDLAYFFGGRYFKVNPESYDRHRTVEFRQHYGTVNFKRIKQWVAFCLALVSWSKTHKLDSDVTDRNDPRIADLPKMPNWPPRRL